MNNKFNYVLSSESLGRIVSGLSDKNAIKVYCTGGFTFKADDLYIHPSIPENIKIELNTDAAGPETDAENAKVIYNALGDKLSSSDASDIRLWVYLSHGPLFKYMQARWPVSDEYEKAVKTVAGRWLFQAYSPVRGLSRHGLSRLWWGARLTRAPWETDEYFAGLKCPDLFRYTKVAFEYQDVFEGLWGRGMGRDRHILIGILEFIRQNKDLHKDREKMRAFFRRLNLEGFHSLLGTTSLKILMRRLEACLD